MPTRAERKRQRREERRRKAAANLSNPGDGPVPPTELVEQPGSESENDGKDSGLLISDDVYAAATATFNSAKEKAAEQYDKTLSAIGTAALGFSYTVFAKLDDPPERLAKMALAVMLAFSFSIFSSLLSFLATFHSIKKSQRLLDRLRQGDRTADPNQRDWLEIAVDWLNWLGLAFLLAGTAVFLWFGYSNITQDRGMAKDNVGQPHTTVVPNHQGSGKPAVVMPSIVAGDIPGLAKGGAGKPTISLPAPRMTSPPVEAPKPTSTPPSGSTGGK